MNTMEERERELFDEWARNYPSGFYRDGVPNPECYLQTRTKCIFVLREANFAGEQKHYEFRNELRENPQAFWRQKVMPWCYGLAEANGSSDWESLWLRAREARKDHAKCIEYLSMFGYIQIKKSPGSSTAKREELETAAQRDQAFIRRQIAIYQPDIIVACGIGTPTTFDLLVDFVFQGSADRCTDGGFKRRCAQIKAGSVGVGSTLLIETLHPSHRTKRAAVFNQLISDFQHALAQNNRPDTNQ